METIRAGLKSRSSCPSRLTTYLGVQCEDVAEPVTSPKRAATEAVRLCTLALRERLREVTDANCDGMRGSECTVQGEAAVAQHLQLDASRSPPISEPRKEA